MYVYINIVLYNILYNILYIILAYGIARVFHPIRPRSCFQCHIRSLMKCTFHCHI